MNRNDNYDTMSGEFTKGVVMMLLSSLAKTTMTLVILKQFGILKPIINMLEAVTPILTQFAKFVGGS